MSSGTVSVSELKANLSRYLREVRRGGELQVTDRGTPVARLVPPAEPEDEHLSRLIKLGVLRAGQGDAAAVLDEPPLQIPTSLAEALAEEREDRA
ncbi:type II toxin-antitoxin system Phd/YefM family antitoxin [Candidatus Poriferisodalis sp.]|uniref:type II toxin-antitoxin system Phd/YefM family antitoxin n=1 Tax=Candidatus Poriferisodalis sp. TaxID=3101277 RepID=UPI003B5C54E2